ncbi:alpha/beta hydrolase [Micrococcus sp.]|uniref:alpha/beta fold hydrolase n=1 Tax=Micrococcus sp. TaxID=1271 RepID=UPI002A912AF3|nr:alpha/beta hydrolase [Micrococcus sp.]MDY6055453.1 alpha/beta hydrolase [Micrococcus sp.]
MRRRPPRPNPAPPPVRLRDRLHPPAPPHDTAELTGFTARTPHRCTVPVPDPVSGTATDVAVWQYPAHGDDGARPPLVFVHGFRGDHHGLALVADALPEHTVHSVELPGFGASAAFPDAEHTVAHHAAAVRAAVDALLGPDPARTPLLVAHSYGTIVASHLVAKDPTRWAGLVLLNPIAEPALDASGSMTARAAAWTAEAYYELAARLPERPGRALLGAAPAVWATTLLMSRTRDRRVLAYTHDQHRRWFSAFASRRMLAEAYRASTTSTVLDAAPSLHLPVTLVAGAEDPLGSVAAQQHLAAAIDAAGGHADLHVLDGVGHLLHYERPLECAALIRRASSPTAAG